jgi:hypothetical protein
MSFIGRLWRSLKQAYAYLLPLRFNLFALAILLFAFRFSAQGRDILRALGEGREHFKLDLFLFVMISNVLAYEVWYWSRHLLRYRPHTDPHDSCRDPLRDPLPADLPWTTTWVPRLLGLVVFVIEIVGFLAVKTTPVWIYVWLGASAIVYWIVVVKRRDFFPSLRQTQMEHVSVWSEYGKATRVMLVVAAVIELALFIWALTHPVSWHILGVAATLVLTVAVWIPLGTFLVGLGVRWRFPLLAALLVWAVIISRWTDNHVIRTAGPVLVRPQLERAFDDWYRRAVTLHPPGSTIPVIIVAAEGGGIRAAYWTATSLAAVTDQVPQFADHCFAVSGVSGGSIGALVYDAIVARRLDAAGAGANDPRPISAILGPAPKLQDDVRPMLKFDVLSGTLAALAQPDLFQRFIPAAVLPDREKALERGLETGWSSAFHNDLFGAPFLATMNAHPRLPNLFLNGTVVETGERIVTSNVHVHNSLSFRNAFDAFDQMNVDIPISAAAGMSSRFTYVSPAGKIVYNGSDKDKARVPATCTAGDAANPNYRRALFGHVVDGGYFENSGAVTAAEIVAFIADYTQRKNYKVQQFVILIDHWDSMASGNCPTDETPFCPAPGVCGPLPPAKAEDFMNEVMSPLRGVLNARNARGLQAIGDIALVMRENIVELRLAPTTPGEAPLPLGWVLSDAAMDILDHGVTNQKGNGAAIRNIRNLLAGAPIDAPKCDTAQCTEGVAQKGSSYGGE